MIRARVPADTPTLITLTDATGVFKKLEIQALQEVLDDFHAENHKHHHECVTFEDAGAILGFAYFAPAAMTDRTWYLYWIAVSKQTQAKGVGSQLLKHVEESVRRAGGRILIIETSSLPHYDLTRRFYLKHGYDQEARIRDFYADGDDLIAFRKRLGATP
jgi:ribosomal protein S18 acetylase RimI-like enzyme